MKSKLFKTMCLVSGAICLLFLVCAYLAAWFLFGAGSIHDDYLMDAMMLIPLFTLSIFFLGCLVSLFFSTKLSRAISSGKKNYEELEPLKNKIRNQQFQLRENENQLEQREGGIRAIMQHMTDGIILLDARGLIIMMNKSAHQLLLADGEDYEGKHVFAVNRDPLLQSAVHFALGGEAAEELIEMPDRVIEVVAKPVYTESRVGEVSGAVLLIFDVTEKRAAEKLRQEFSANVSHELKTPLTSISGYAELLKNGLVKPEDVSHFSENIYSEAKRLIHLIDDIINLSKLDEGRAEPRLEDVSLLEVSRDVCERLRQDAAKYEVSLSVGGDDAHITANARLIDEMIYNLCENSIKYNHPGGSVDITVTSGEGAAVLTVKDTGIGIKREHLPRVFERFYRVDKSHSKETGGTGLGLSIVKRGALYHGALVDIDSSPGIGTTVSLRFERDSKKPLA